MKKPTTKKLSFTAHTIRQLQGDQLAQVNGGSVSVINPSGGITSLKPSLISLNPSGG